MEHDGAAGRVRIYSASGYADIDPFVEPKRDAQAHTYLWGPPSAHRESEAGCIPV